MAVLSYFPAACVFTVEVTADAPVGLTLYKVPGPAAKALGSLMVNWGDGTDEALTCVAGIADIEAMAEDDNFTALAHFTHSYKTPGRYQVRIGCAGGFLPLAQLPDETVSIDAALPKLTRGETDARGRVLPSDPLPQLVKPAAGAAHAKLASVVPDLLAANPEISVLDHAFEAVSVTHVAPGLFSPLKYIASAASVFENSLLTEIPAGLLSACDADSYVRRAFAGCPISRMANPFAGEAVPYCSEELMAGAAPQFFAPFKREDRPDLGWVRPDANETDPAFEFEVTVKAGVDTPVVRFYPMDTAAPGDFLIDWGDGTSERIAFEAAPEIRHTWEKTGHYRVRLMSTIAEPVRPFRLTACVRRIYSALPDFYPRDAANCGDFTGWAADCRELISVPEHLFRAIAGDIRVFDEAFAGCIRLEEAPDRLLEGIAPDVSVTGAFAFCKRLMRLPRSHAERSRNKRLDAWASPLSERSDTEGETL